MKNNNILVITNNVLLRKHIEVLLKNSLPACCSYFVAGKHALGFLSVRQWSTLISDMDTPELTGLQLIDALAELDSKAQLVLIQKYPPVITEAIKAHAIHKKAQVTLVNSASSAVQEAEVNHREHAFVTPPCIAKQPPATLDFSAVSPLECLEKTIAYYQPQFRVASKELYGAEALARWDFQKIGVLGPLHILPMLHNVVLRDALWKKMLGFAVCTLQALQSTTLNIAVNVCADVANSVSWSEHLTKRLKQSGINKERLTIEITESIEQDLDKGLIGAITQLRLRGFKCALDDFGTGFSSLQRLATVPFSELKIDRGFIVRARSSIEGQKYLSNTVALAHDLGLTVIAEGIETKGDFERIKKLGVDIAQGYYFSRPLPAEEFLRYAQSIRMAHPEKV